MVLKNKEGQFILKLFILTIVISLTLLTVAILFQVENWNCANQIRMDLAKSNTARNFFGCQEIIDKYIANQEYLKENWWNTIINQSGLSIIVTLIVLLITFTFNFTYKQELNEKFDKKINDLNDNYISKLKGLEVYSTNVTKEIKKVLIEHRGSLNAKLYKYHQILEKYIKRLNSLSELKTLDKNDFIDLYTEDVKSISIGFTNLLTKNEPILINDGIKLSSEEKISQSIDLFYKIEKDEDRTNVYDYLKYYKNSLDESTANKDNIELFLTKIEKIFNIRNFDVKG
ncbi:MAG TPA: hypothetical protein DDW65_21715 [Firmicutes bacterium]|jgi:hypothetical protein|nr:hypothetical protein [Bacillota bacterium]